MKLYWSVDLILKFLVNPVTYRGKHIELTDGILFPSIKNDQGLGIVAPSKNSGDVEYVSQTHSRDPLTLHEGLNHVIYEIHTIELIRDDFGVLRP